MPSMANIVVKKADGTTDVTYTALQPASGDGVAAVWRNEAAGTSSAVKPTVSMSSRWNGPKTARRIDVSFVYPHTYTDANTGLALVKDKVPVTLSAVVPAAVPDTVVAEAVAQAMNLFDSTLFVDSVKTGYAPT